MRKIRKLIDIVQWNLCTGCGACFYHCDKNAVEIKNHQKKGIIPIINKKKCVGCDDCLAFCPGYAVSTNIFENSNKYVGHAFEIWKGFACSNKIRYAGSSGGLITALSIFCLEKLGMELVVHTGMDQNAPWKNITKISRSREEILLNAGSRYNVSSPCDSLKAISDASKPCVFVGKPCDVAAVHKLRKKDKKLDKNLGLVLSFFCAGTPTVEATLNLLKNGNIDINESKTIKYRGNGWPGSFEVRSTKESLIELSYMDSWELLAKNKLFRCNICPDGLGELSDITCGDAWHEYKQDDNPGRSLVLARSNHGVEILKKARDARFIELEKSNYQEVIAAQGLVMRRMELFGRLTAMKMILRPIPYYKNFYLKNLWKTNSYYKKTKIILGTLRRLILKGYWRRENDII